MSGYAVGVNSRTLLINQPETLEEIYGYIFYGLKYNSSNGRLTFEKIEEDEPIVLPVDGQINESAYTHWFSSVKNISLVSRNENSSHLYMEVI